MTFSMAAFDRASGQLGIAVQSKAFAVGAAVPWAAPGVGAIATQANTNIQYGPDGLALLRDGLTPAAAIQQLTAGDEGRKIRQVGIVDGQGRSANYTGENCLSWAGALSGDGWTCQGNILAGPGVVRAMAEAYTGASGPLPERLLAALAAGQEAGGDARGVQSAALLVVGPGADRPDGRLFDIRVDDHHKPIEELTRLYHVRKKLMDHYAAEWLEYEGDVVLIAEQLMQRRAIPSLHRLAEALGVPDGIRGNKISQRFRQAINLERRT